MKIIWSVASKDSYLTIIEQLFVKWNISIVERFELQVSQLLHNIVEHNHICPKSRFIALHKCVINKQISLIYRVKNKNCIEIVVLIFNESEHSF